MLPGQIHPRWQNPKPRPVPPDSSLATFLKNRYGGDIDIIQVRWPDEKGIGFACEIYLAESGTMVARMGHTGKSGS